MRQAEPGQLRQHRLLEGRPRLRLGAPDLKDQEAVRVGSSHVDHRS